MIVCWFSCGAASAVATKFAIEKYGIENIRIVNNPVVTEHPDNKRFMKSCEKWFGKQIEIAINPCYKSCNPEDVWNDYRIMSMPRFAPCSRELKQYARRQWEHDNNFNNKKDIIVMGFTSEEENRINRFKEKHKEYNLDPILLEKGFTKQMCWDYINNADIAVPKMYLMGYDNANCIGCVYGGIGYWQKIKKDFPEIFDRRAKLSRQLGCKLLDLGKNKEPRHRFLDELTDDMKGTEPKGFDCGIFCASEITDKGV